MIFGIIPNFKSQQMDRLIRFLVDKISWVKLWHKQLKVLAQTSPVLTANQFNISHAYILTDIS